MSGDDIRGAIDRARAPDPIDCPVTALGQRDGTYFFLATSGEIRAMRARDMTALGLLSLFDGDGTWLLENFPKEKRQGTPTEDFVATWAAAVLMRLCARAGIFDLGVAVRSVGVRRGGSPDEIICHCGDALIIYRGQERTRARAGMRTDEGIYVAAPALEHPATSPADRQLAAELLEAIRLWNFAGEHLPKLVLGFIAVGMLGAAPPWRAHILVVGKRGSGKSALLRLIRAALGAMANAMNDPTEAGLREALSGQARAIIFDEAAEKGGEDRTVRVTAIVGLLRRMAGDDGAKSIRGTGGSGARQYVMAGSVALAAVNPPVLDPQDRSRILEVSMLEAEPGNKDKVERAIEELQGASPRLRARAIAAWSRFRDNLHVYRQELLDVGCDARQADQLGTLLAGAEMMLSDHPVDSDSAKSEVDELRQVLAVYRADDQEMSNGRQCLTRLYTSQVEHWSGGLKSTVGRIVISAREATGTEHRRALPAHGLRLERTKDGRPVLWVANQHQGLERIFHGSSWQKGGWKRALEELPGVAAGKDARFDGAHVRYVVIPADYLPSDDEEKKPEDDPT